MEGVPDLKDNTITPRPDAKEIWEHPQSHHQKNDAVSSLYDYRQLHRTTLVDDGTLEAQIDRLIQLRSRCTLNGLELDDSWFAATILIALPESYSHITDSLLANGKIEDLTVEGVRAKILETEVRRKNEADPAANAVRKTAQSSTKKRPKGSCFTCGKKGHHASQCTSEASLPDTPASTSPPPRDQDYEVKTRGEKDNPPILSGAAVNNVDSSSTECDITVYFYDRTVG